MNIHGLASHSFWTHSLPRTEVPSELSQADGERATNPELREAFRDFVGQTLFSQMLRAMRQTLGKPPYFHGGRMEEVFQVELDRLLVEKAARKTGDQFADEMFELFSLRLR
jgi:hypothetical protein